MFCFLDLCNLCSKITNKAPYNTVIKQNSLRYMTKLFYPMKY